MDLSLNEVEAQARKAVRGAGYQWGEAEEAGRAIRWLCRHSIDGCALLAALLRADMSPGTCPIKAGITLADFAKVLTEDPMTVGPVAVPMILVPFAANAAVLLERAVEIGGDDWSVQTIGDQLNLQGTPIQDLATVQIRLCNADLSLNSTRNRAHPSPETWAILGDFAHRTYAPATEESRKLGAGSGLSDND